MAVTGEDLRPRLARLSERIVLQEQAAYRDLFTQALGAAREPVPGSLWARDRDAAAGNEGALGALAHAGEQFQVLQGSIEAHSEALVLLLRHERLLLVSALALCRAIFEPVLWSCWLTDPSATSRKRIARAASLGLGTSQGTLNQLAKFDSPDLEITDKRKARADLVAWYERHGLEVVWATRKGKPADEIVAVRFEGEKASLNPQLTQMAQDFVPASPFLYGLLSGAVHSRPWLLSGLAGHHDDALRMFMGPLLDISDAYTVATCTYLGLDAAPFLARRRPRMKALLTTGFVLRTPTTVRATAFSVHDLTSGLRPDELSG